MKSSNVRKLSGKRALVTGGAGFLGSHLCKRLLKDDFHVIALDNLCTGSRQNLAPLLGSERFRFIEHDVVDPIHCEVDWVFNLACCASPQHYQRDPVKTMRTCLDGALNMLRLAQRTGARVLQASTSEVYGEPERHPQPESYRGSVNPIGPRACYDEGKRCAEAMFFDMHRTHGVEIKVARIFNTYGPQMQQDDGRVVSNFIVQALRGEPLTVYGDGGQTRSFCYVDDLIDGLLRLMASPPTFTGPVNLGNPNEVTVLQLARRILKLTGSRSEIVQRPIPTDDPTRRQPDIALARSALGWEPKTPLDAGLRATVRYFAELLAAEQQPMLKLGGRRA